MTTEVNKTAQEMSLVPFKTMVPSVAPLSLTVPSRSSIDIDLVAPKFRAELAKERAEEKKREADRKRIEQEQYARSQQLSRRAVFTSD